MLRPKSVLLLTEILQNPTHVLRKHDVFYSSMIPEATCYRSLDNNIYIYIYIYTFAFFEYLYGTIGGTSLKLVDKFTYLGSSVSSAEKDIDALLMNALTTIDRLSIIWKSDLTDKMKRNFFQAAVVSILTRMLRAILNKSWKQHPTRYQLYVHLPLITKTIQARRTTHVEHFWRNRDELISDVLLWTPTYDRAKAGRPARTCIQQLCEDTGCSPEDLPQAMNVWEKWRERVRDISAGGTTWWWWWWWYGTTYKTNVTWMLFYGRLKHCKIPHNI